MNTDTAPDNGARELGERLDLHALDVALHWLARDGVTFTKARIVSMILANGARFVAEPSEARREVEAALGWCIDYIEGISGSTPTRPPEAQPFLGERLARFRAAIDTAIRVASPPEVERLREALERIHQPLDGLRRLHPRTKQITDRICEECDRPWPCDTAMVLHPAEGSAEK